jgi:hypothetical protein
MPTTSPPPPTHGIPTHGMHSHEQPTPTLAEETIGELAEKHSTAAGELLSSGDPRGGGGAGVQFGVQFRGGAGQGVSPARRLNQHRARFWIIICNVLEDGTSPIITGVKPTHV